MEMNIIQYDAGHMTKLAAIPIYGKNPSKIFFRNQRADFHETLYEASGTPAHHIFSNDNTGVTLTYFMARSNFVT